MSKIKTNTIQHNAVGAATFTLPTADGTAGQVLKTDGSGNLSWTTIESGPIKEQWYGFADGSTITLKDGDHTLQNPSALQDLNTTWTTLEGTQLSYTPPSGTNLVIWECSTNMRYNDQYARVWMRAAIDGTAITDSVWTAGSNDYTEAAMHMRSRIWITGAGSDDIAKGKVDTWTSAKTLTFEAREYHASNEGYANYGDPGFVRPHIGITAIQY